MNDSEKLKIMLKDLIPCIEGKWFVGDGALLGLIRKGDLLEFDDDIDIFITPETKINWDKLPDKYNYYKDYICYKLYNGLGREPHKISPWIRYLQYMRLLPLQVSQRPPTTLKLKRPNLYPRIIASGILANKALISPKTPV